MIRAAVLGADVSKSRSPAIHNAAFRALGLDGVYEHFSVPPNRFAAKVKLLQLEGYRYVNVTIPYKMRAAKLGRSLGPEVKASRAANTLIFGHGRVRAENTDGAGLIAALADLDVSPCETLIVMVGAGGAAAGAVEALTRAGAFVWLLPRRLGAGHSLRRRLPADQQRRVRVGAWESSLKFALTGAAALVSAVPANAWISREHCAGLDALKDSTAVVEMAYGARTPLAKAVRARTNRYADGLGMLVHQAARAIELALGEKPPLKPLFRAAHQGV
jgi:shikimate dehydrogenase